MSATPQLDVPLSAPAVSPLSAISVSPLLASFRSPKLVQRLAARPEYIRRSDARPAEMLPDLVVATEADPYDPAQVFPRLRWGGVYVFASPRGRLVQHVAQRCRECGFIVEDGPAHVREGFLNLPLLSRKINFMIARKTHLIPPGEVTERFTYDVRLAPHTDPNEPYVVLKEVPDFEGVMARLRSRFPDAPTEALEKRARKFADKIFPTFLTREAAILRVLQKYLPRQYARRVPQVINIERDERGFVRKLRMNWLRNGGRALSQLEFAQQSADLLRALHDQARVIHLDLRLDNFVITDEGVGFVDFGSAVRDGEDLDQNPLLSTLFAELMRTSQIQRMLEKMTLTGAVTSHAIKRGYQKVDKAVDLFYLAVQFNEPHSNPDLAGLIEHDRSSSHARALKRLTKEILRPSEPAHPKYRTAADILEGVGGIAACPC